MTLRTASRITWSVCGFSLTLTALSLVLLALHLSHPDVPTFEYWVEVTVVATSTSLMGAFIASRRPQHPIGWLFLAIGFLGAIDHFCGQYATYALLARSGSLPAGEAAAWVRTWIWFVAYSGIGALLLLVFPDGRLPSRRWRAFAWLVPIVSLVGSTVVAFAPGAVDGLGPVQNPLGIQGLEMAGRGGTVEAVETFLLLPLEVGAVASLVVRLRRSRGVERQQVKWLAYAMVVTVAGGALTYVVYDLVRVPWWIWWSGFSLLMVGLVGQPVAVGVAVFRYRLYDVDLLINRTLVYGVLTAILVTFYVGGVVFLQYAFRAVAGQGSTLAIVASTLAIAALFTPLRRGIQAFIDRRFYRKKYDARKTLEGFSATLRDETNLEALNEQLVGVVRETMQPAHVSLWLRPDRGERR
jgi:hypothetical protein